MDEEQTFVIVGVSLAGAKAAETLRDEGFDVRARAGSAHCGRAPAQRTRTTRMGATSS